MLQAILSFFGIVPSITGAINSITNAISNEKIAAIAATTQQDQIASAERVASLQAQRDALIAEVNKSNWPIYIQSAMALPIVFILGKLFVYDDAGFGTTDIPNDSNQWKVIMIVVGFYFLHSIASIFK